MLNVILFRKNILFSFQSYKYFKTEPEIDKKLRVEWTKLQICQSQTKSDINRNGYHYTRKWMASTESKNTNWKTKSKTVVSRG